jgi:YHS domain-containing protein
VFVTLIAITMRRGTKDPVCGMTVDRGGPTSSYAGRTFTFCGNHCKHTFDANPGAYA